MVACCGAALAVIASAATAAPGAATRWRVFAPVPVSGPVAALSACGLNHDDNTPQLAVDPADPRRLAITYFTGDDAAAVAAVSADEGRTWSRSVLPGLTTCTGGPPGQLVDPSLGFAPDGSLLATPGWVKSAPAITDRDHDAIRQYASRSVDDGATWSSAVDVAPSAPYQRGYLAHGPRGDELLETEQAPFDATTYAYPQPGGLDILASPDDGRSWQRTATIPATPGFALLAAGLLRSGGAIVALGIRANLALALPLVTAGQLGLTDGALPSTLIAAVSQDGGRTFSRPIVVAHCDGGLTCDIPRATAGPGGRLFITYTVKHLDGTYGLRVSTSTDAGRHWSPHPVTDLARLPDVAAIAARRGQVAVLELEPDAGNPELDYAVLHISTTGGMTWSRHVLAGPFDKSTITYTHFDGQLGPEIDLAPLPDGFGATYTVLAPYPLLDGEQDVVFQRIVDGGAR